MNSLKSFLNVKTLGVVVAGTIAILVIYPSALVYLPLLLLAACPLMMLSMMGGGHDSHGGQAAALRSRNEPSAYACLMHPEVQSALSGKCPICGMDLRPLEPTLRG